MRTYTEDEDNIALCVLWTASGKTRKHKTHQSKTTQKLFQVRPLEKYVLNQIHNCKHDSMKWGRDTPHWWLIDVKLILYVLLQWLCRGQTLLAVYTRSTSLHPTTTTKPLSSGRPTANRDRRVSNRHSLPAFRHPRRLALGLTPKPKPKEMYESSISTI